MAQCIICGEVFYSQTYQEPAQPCWCGEMASHCSLWEWDKYRALLKFARYRTAKVLYRVADWLTQRKERDDA